LITPMTKAFFKKDIGQI